MKTKTLLLSIFAFVLSISTFAQNPASSVNIPVQGIARDANNTARTGQDVAFIFEFYYLDSGTEFPILSAIEQTLRTDAYGVFSTSLVLGGDKSYLIANNRTHLRISVRNQTGGGTTIISNEPLSHVPYAVAANNGVPTGSIMPFMGATAPPGWLLCDGSAIPTGADFDPLRNLLGNANTPNLQGLFLRGIGQYDANRVGPAALGDIQGDDNKSHSHGNNIRVRDGAGSHSHTMFLGDGGGSTRNTPVGGDAIGSTGNGQTRDSGSHNHTMEGSIHSSGGTESRPINYGVNYIIKL